jgi:hypothetical protein
MRPSHATTEPDVTRAETLQNVHALARESLRAIGTYASGEELGNAPSQSASTLSHSSHSA